MVRLQPGWVVQKVLADALLLVGGGDLFDHRHQRLEVAATPTTGAAEMAAGIRIVTGRFGDGGMCAEDPGVDRSVITEAQDASGSSTASEPVSDRTDGCPR